MMRVKPVPGEATRFWVESGTLQCVVPECAAMFQRSRHPHLRIGGPCPKCAGTKCGTLDVRFHVVDLAVYEPVGQCSCEYFCFTLAPKLARLSPAERTRTADLHRCSHIRAARDFALDLVVRNHQVSFGGGVEAAP